jgi:hypothetical protein
LADDKGEDRKPAVSAAELKARLGLSSAPGGGNVQQSAAQAAREATLAAAALEDEIASARRRAAQALAAAGPPAEDFSVLGEHRTPPPARLDRLTPAEIGRGQRFSASITWSVLVLAAGVGSYFLGHALGTQSVDRQIHDLYIDEAKAKLGFFEGEKAPGGELLLDRIEAIKTSIEETMAAVDKAEAGGGDDALAAAEPKLLELIPKLIQYRDDKVYFSAEKMLGELVYNYDVIAEALKYASSTERLYVQVVDGLEEMQVLSRLARPAGNTVRVLVAMPGTSQKRLTSWSLVRDGKPVELTECKADAECPAGYACKAPACEASGYPVASGQLATEVGDPTLVTVTDPDGKNPTQSWEARVSLAGTAEPVQVKTSQIVGIDLAPVFADHAVQVRRMRLGRLATIVRSLHGAFQSIHFKPVREKLLAWKDKPRKT